MKLLFDANISYRIVKKLQSDFPNALHVSRSGLVPPIEDRDIWQFAKRHNYIVVTFDEDFYDLLNIFGAPPKVIWLRFGNLPTDDIAKKLIAQKSDIEILATDSDTEILEIY